MQDRTKMVMAGGALGLVVAGTLALPVLAPLQSQAQERVKTLLGSAAAFLPAEHKPFDSLVRFDVAFEPGVSQEPLASAVVRKIAFGRTSFVTVATTASGVYSSDAIGSANVRYPGVHVTQPAPSAGGIAFVAEGPFWTAVPAAGAGSFLMMQAFPSGTLSVSPEGSCVILAKATYC
jgi:hypothetical protein